MRAVDPHAVLFRVAFGALAGFARRRGGVYLKMGQFLGTRADLLPAEAIPYFRRLHDDARPLSRERLKNLLARKGWSRGEGPFRHFDALPVATGAVAQVHRAVLWDNSVVAVKLRRPGVQRIFHRHARALRMMGRGMERLPMARGLGISRSAEELADVLVAQTDFAGEAAAHHAFERMFSDDPDIRVPKARDELCDEDAMVMDYVEDFRPLLSPRPSHRPSQELVRVAFRAIYRMLFGHGLVHCDLHPGNVGVDEEGKLVLIDFGLVARLDALERRALAEVFLGLAMGDVATVRSAVVGVAERVPPGAVGALESELRPVVERHGGRANADFSVAGFVGDLLRAQRASGVIGGAGMTMAIVSLMMFEGTARQVFPELDFQREALPHVLECVETMENGGGRRHQTPSAPASSTGTTVVKTSP